MVDEMEDMMTPVLPRLLVTLLLLGAIVAVACENETTGSGQDASDRIQREAREGWASLRTDGERLLDDVQARNDPEAKKRFLDRCRDTEERLRTAKDANADAVNEFCDKVRDADVNNTTAWDELRREWQQLKQRFGS